MLPNEEPYQLGPEQPCGLGCHCQLAYGSRIAGEKQVPVVGCVVVCAAGPTQHDAVRKPQLSEESGLPNHPVACAVVPSLYACSKGLSQSYSQQAAHSITPSGPV